MEKNIQDKITALEAAINSPATPENIKETMRKALDTLRNQKVEVALYKTYSTIKSCLLDDGDDSDDYIYEGKRIHNVEVLPKDTWEIVEFYNYGVVLKHIPTSVLADSKPNKNVSLDELKVLFASDKIEIDGIEKGNTKVFNLCIKAIIKCIDSLDMAAYKENLLAELNVSKNELEKTIEASNLLESEKNAILSEKSNLEKESAEKIQTLESDMAAKSISMEEAKAIQEAETLRLKKQIEDLDALNSMRTLIDMLTDDIAKKDFKETPSIESNEKIKVKEIRLFAAEGKVSGYGFPKVVNTYEEANDAVMPVYEDAIESSYANKCRFTVTFEDGETYNGDLFVGAKYDNPTKGNVIGKHIKDYLESEIKENRQSEETKKEIREFFEKYDLGFDENKLDEKNPKYKVGDILLHEYMGEKQKAKILAVTGWTGDGHRYEIEFVDKNNNGIGKFATSYDDILTKDAANGDYEDINAFVDYVNDFYGKDGIYAKDFSNNGFTKEEIKEAVNKYISDIDKRDDDDFTWGDGDSVDRERVRQYLQPNGLKFNDGDFVFANMDSRDPKSKTPFVISHYSNGKYYILGDGSHYVSEDKLSLATEKDFDDYYTELGFDKKAIDSYKNIKYSNGGELKVPYQEIITHTKGEIDLTKSRDEFAKEFSELYGKQNKKRVTPKTIEYFRNDSGSYHTVRDVLEDIETNDFNDVISVFKKVYPVASNDWKEALRTGLLVKSEKRAGNYYNKPYIYNEPIAVKIREARLDNLKPLIEEILSDDKYENGGGVKSLYKIRFDGALGEGLYFVTEANSPKEAKDISYKEMSSTDKIKSEPEKTNESFIGTAKKRNDTHWIVRLGDYLKPLTHEEFVKMAKEKGYESAEDASKSIGYRYNGEKWIDARNEPYKKIKKMALGGRVGEEINRIKTHVIKVEKVKDGHNSNSLQIYFDDDSIAVIEPAGNIYKRVYAISKYSTSEAGDVVRLYQNHTHFTTLWDIFEPMATGELIDLMSNGGSIGSDNIVGEFYYDTRKGKAFRVISIDGTSASGVNRKDGTSDMAIQYYSDDKKPVGEIETVNSNEFNYLVKTGAWNKWKQSYFEKGGAVKGARENIVLKANEILGVDSSFHFISDNEFTIEPMSEDEKFNGMALNSFPDGTYEVAEFLAGKDGKDLYIFGNYKSLVPALKSLALGNSSTGRKPIKVEKFEKGGGIGNERFIFGIEYKQSPTSRVFKKSSLAMVGRDTKEMNDAINENANLLKKQEGWHDFKITKTPIMENGGSINDKITSKAKHEMDFLTKKGYDIDVYSTLNQDAIFGGEKIDDFIIATQGSIGTGKDVKFAIAYWYKDEEDGEMQISRALLDEISDLFKGSPVTLYTNAGVDLHSITDGKHKNIQVVKVPYGEFSGNSDEYAEGGQIEMSFSAEEQKDWSKEKTRMYDLYAVAHNNIADLKDELKRAKLRKDSQLVRMLESRIRQTEFAKKSAKEYFDKYEKGGKLKGSWGQSFPEEGRTGMYKGASVIVTSNRAGDILFDELDEDEKVVKSDKASLSEFRSYFRPFEPRETDVIYEKGGEIKIVQKQLDDNKDLSFEIYPKGEKMTIENGFHGILVDGKLKNTIYIGNEYYDIDGVVYKNDKKTNLKL